MLRRPRAGRTVPAAITCYIHRLNQGRVRHMPLSPAQLAERLHACGEEIAHTGRELAARGWTPATSSNFSMRIDDAWIAITLSGRDKGALTAADVMAIGLDGEPAEPALRASAETALHLQMYRRLPAAGAVLHTHSRNQTVASRLFAPQAMVALHGWELQKAITGYTTHDSALDLPVFPNSQDMGAIESSVAAWLDTGTPLYAYLIEGHGLYTWGRDMPEARRHLEALEFLLACELDLKRLGAIP